MILNESAQSVLVIDDSKPQLKVLGEILSNIGLSVSEAENCKQALQSLTSNLPDLIICDIKLPDMSGVEFHKQLRENSSWCTIPFLYLSAVNDPFAKKDAIEQGCDDYILKPFCPDDLITIVKGKLKLSEQRKKIVSEKIESHRKRIIKNLSHEFRTPLVSIKAGTELLISNYDDLDRKEVLEVLNSIQRGGERLDKLVKDFLIIQQIENGRAKYLANSFKAKCSFIELVNQSLKTFLERNHTLSTKKIDLKVRDNIDPKEDFVEVYSEQVEDIFNRILDNAIKFSPDEEIIVVSVDKTEDNISALIHDQGPGIPEEKIKEICRMFTQIDRDFFEQQGCGLGLTIASFFAEINGGLLNFQTPQAGSGLIVEVQFPLT